VKVRVWVLGVALLLVAALLGVSGTSHARGGGHEGGHARGHEGHGRHGDGRAGAGRRVAMASEVFVSGWPFWLPIGYEPGAGYPFPGFVSPMAEDLSPPPYIQRELPVEYWYYCLSRRGYYPYVGECPDGWIHVLPQPGPPWPPP